MKYTVIRQNMTRLLSTTEHIPAISRTSKIELAESLAEAKNSLSKLSAFLTIVLFSIGILNFINTMSANILNRKKEFASMEAVGATRRQVRGMIVWEGFWYFASTMTLALTLDSAADVLLFAAIQNSLVISQIRKKLNPDDPTHGCIRTVVNSGYKFVA